MAGEAEDPAEPTAIEEMTFGVDGDAWVARRIGMVGGGRTLQAPLMLVGFWRKDSPEGVHLRETMMVGTTLASLSSGALAEAFAGARPYEPRAPSAGADSGSGRERGGGRRGRGGRGGRGGAGRSGPT